MTHLGPQWLTSRDQVIAAEKALAQAIERACPDIHPCDMEYLAFGSPFAGFPLEFGRNANQASERASWARAMRDNS